MATTQVMVTGDSHTGALRRGLDLLREQGWSAPGIEIEVVGMGNGADFTSQFFVDRGRHAEIVHPDYRRRVPILPRPRAVARRTVHAWTGLFHFPRVWRAAEWSRFRPATVPGREAPVSRALVRDTVLGWFGPQLALLEVLQRVPVPVLALETPRPFRHHPALRAVRPEVVAGLDRLCLATMAGELEARGIPVLRIPPECIDGEGFMHERWRHENPKDSHHGNAAFGAMMIQRICQYVGDPR